LIITLAVKSVHDDMTEFDFLWGCAFPFLVLLNGTDAFTATAADVDAVVAVAVVGFFITEEVKAGAESAWELGVAGEVGAGVRHPCLK
jgi:hypothetical protein